MSLHVGAAQGVVMRAAVCSAHATRHAPAAGQMFRTKRRPFIHRGGGWGQGIRRAHVTLIHARVRSVRA